MSRKTPTARCRRAQDCLLCPERIKPGMWMKLEYASGEWVHAGCLVRKVVAGKRAEQ
jgi:hypothetical protein